MTYRRDDYQHWYKLPLWKKERKIFLQKNPLCVRCLHLGKYVSATVVNHIVPHKGDWDLFRSQSNWQAVCKDCHDGLIQSEERRGYSVDVANDGWPIDSKHPVNRKDQG